MNITEEIDAVEAKIAALEQQLNHVSVSEPKELTIRYQIIENTKLLTELYKQYASEGENDGEFNFYFVVFIFINLYHHLFFSQASEATKFIPSSYLG